jgi:hypothetical protein
VTQSHGGVYMFMVTFTSILMMMDEQTSEILVCELSLMIPIAREDFGEFICCETFRITNYQ